MQFTVEAQDIVTGRTYTDGYTVFKVKKTRAQGTDRMIIRTTSGRVLLANNTQGFKPVK